jgi:DNA-binding transcriptional LysR family regulator
MFNITLLQIKTFLSVAEKLNFSEAAKEMEISQPSLSQTVSRIEEGIGVKLFERGKHGVELTQAGEYVYLELKPIYNKIIRLFDHAVNLDNNQNKSLRIVCHTSHLSSGARLYFDHIVTEYRNKYPDVSLIEELYDLKDMEKAFISGEADLIFTEAFSLDNIRNVSMKKVMKHQFCVVMSIHHPLAACDTLDIEQLNNEVFYSLSLYDGDSARHGALELCKKAGFTPKEIRFLRNFPSVLAAVRQGYGMTLSGFSGILAEDPQIKYFTLPDETNPIYWVVAWRRDDISETALNFINMIP